MKKEFSFKKDKYKSARGGYSRLLDICCRKCDATVLVYQKDGPGTLRRLYVDRILDPPSLMGIQSLKIKEIPALKCKVCKEIIGTAYIYKKEKRKTFRLYQDAIVRKLRKLKK